MRSPTAHEWDHRPPADPLPPTSIDPSSRPEQTAVEGPAPSAPPRVPRTRKSSKPLIIVAQSPARPAIDAALERWEVAHPEAAAHLQPADILVDRMRGSAYIWYRLRLNLEHIPTPLRPPQETIDPDDDPTRTTQSPLPQAGLKARNIKAWGNALLLSGPRTPNPI